MKKSLILSDPELYFRTYNHIVPYRGEWSAAHDPYFKLFLIFADHFDRFFRSRNGVRFNFSGTELNRRIVKDWDEMVLRLGCKVHIIGVGHIGISHPYNDCVSGDMRSLFLSVIWVEYELAFKIMALGYLP